MGSEMCIRDRVRIAALASNRTEIDGVVSWRVGELNRLGVDIRCGVRATASLICAERPDAVILATGAVPDSSAIEGADAAHVIDVVQALDPNPDCAELLSKARTAVVVDNGSGFWETCSVAETLALRGIAVSFLSPARGFAEALPFEASPPLLLRLKRLGVDLFPMHRVAWIEPTNVIAYDAVASLATGDLKDRTLPADVVVLHSGKRAMIDLLEPLRAAGLDPITVGDCVSPRRINQAVFEAHAAARAI